MSHSVEKISDHLQEVATGNTVQADNTITINQSIQRFQMNLIELEK
ncbi:hypothetical protein ACFSUR_28320 [Halalkalibacter alkalisediminis]